ncbi:hypothetical protein [Roseibium sp. RKSG952]|uniref:hypothetical protein n=1 Tax=Roseibium sp. RKSG952 TaxID=2529384 RepID=UPI0012BC2DAF|nr:hypothetical protein [Roseibium sp. RKSG952]MTH98173.1 hypothetical protein [Roseibium sp. RKSG952]
MTSGERWAVGHPGPSPGTIQQRFNRYALAVARGYCPYLLPSIRQHTCMATCYRLTAASCADLQEEAFWHCVFHAEQLRVQMAHTSAAEHPALCENVIFELPDSLTPAPGKRGLEWCHWLLKLNYTQTGIMAGEFWPQETERDRRSRPIPVPEHFFISLRPAIKDKDARFFSLSPRQLAEFHAGHPSHPTLLEAFGCPQNRKDQPPHRPDPYYRRLIGFAEDELARTIQTIEASQIGRTGS